MRKPKKKKSKKRESEMGYLGKSNRRDELTLNEMEKPARRKE